MKSTTITIIFLFTALVLTPALAREPKHNNPKEYTPLEADNPTSGGYQPDPVILTGVGQIVNGALSIAQDPHSRPNIGYSVANMVHGIMNIIVAKIAHKQTRFNSQELQELHEYLAELFETTTEEITEIINKNYCLIEEN